VLVVLVSLIHRASHQMVTCILFLSRQLMNRLSFFFVLLISRELARIFSSLYDGEGAFLIRPSLKAYEMRRGPRVDTWWLHGYLLRRGVYCNSNCSSGAHYVMTMLMDSEVHVAGPCWRSVLSDVSSVGTTITGVGGAAKSDGSGTLVVAFRSPSQQ
jgi:hypothetical protein